MDESNAKKEVEIASREAIKISAQITKVKIRKDADLTEAADMLATIVRTKKNIEKQRKEITAPLNASLKNINAMFKEPTAKLAAAEEIIKAEMLNYQQRVDARAAKRMEKIQDQVDSGELDMAHGMAKVAGVKQAPVGVSSDSARTSFKKIRKVRIINPGELPVGYFLRDRVIEALRLEVELDVKNGAELPTGAEFYEESQVAVRTA